MWRAPDVSPTTQDGEALNETKVLVRVIRSNGVEQYCGFFVGREGAPPVAIEDMELDSKGNPIPLFDDNDIPGLRVLAWRPLDLSDRLTARDWLEQDKVYRKENPDSSWMPRMMAPRHQWTSEKVLAQGWRQIDPKAAPSRDQTPSVFIARDGAELDHRPARPWLTRPITPPAPKPIKMK